MDRTIELPLPIGREVKAEEYIIPFQVDNMSAILDNKGKSWRIVQHQ